ncbi:MAG: TetR/AcrR family transcriptional regulator [bacterium]
MSRVQKRRENARQRVLEAATALFASKGFAETSIASIAGEADVSVGGFYNLFENKETLYRDLIINRTQYFYERLRQARDSGGNPAERMEKMIVEKLALFQQEADTIHVHLSVNPGARMSLVSSFPEQARLTFEQGMAETSAVISEGIRDGLFAPQDASRAAAALEAVSTNLYLAHLEDPAANPAAQVLADAQRYAAAMLRAENSPRKSPGHSKDRETAG